MPTRRRMKTGSCKSNDGNEIIGNASCGRRPGLAKDTQPYGLTPYGNRDVDKGPEAGYQVLGFLVGSIITNAIESTSVSTRDGSRVAPWQGGTWLTTMQPHNFMPLHYLRCTTVCSSWVQNTSFLLCHGQ
ncbi:hypothetical protein ACRALDRAFT_1064622 [Sodiomyces alcalophilus JCM 7366]|uniref:uncharacterized protein n=1 Tax=Sodiomyces alcalophilus JCM 7366 TaxID=591952 RepID=UPI0039B471F1